MRYKIRKWVLKVLGLDSQLDDIYAHLQTLSAIDQILINSALSHVPTLHHRDVLRDFKNACKAANLGGPMVQCCTENLRRGIYYQNSPHKGWHEGSDPVIGRKR